MIVITKRQGKLLNMLLAFICAGIILFILNILNALIFGIDYLDRYVHTGFTFIHVIGVIIGIYNLFIAAKHQEKMKEMKIFYISITGSILCIVVNIIALLT